MFKFHLQKITVFSAMISLLIFMIGSCSPSPPKNSRVAQAERGKALFDEHCGTCHGENRNMALIDTMLVKPPDLTLIKERKGVTEFPIVEMARMIDGRNLVKIHGDRAMPVWGEVFAAQGDDEEAIRGKKGELIAYLMSIQK